MSRDRFEVRLDCWLQRFPLEPNTRRALIETALDSRFEIRGASGSSNRAMAVIHAIASLARVLAIVTRRESLATDHAPLLVQWLSLTFGAAALFVVPSIFAEWGTADLLRSAGLSMVTAAWLLVPFTLYFATLLAPDHRRPPALMLTTAGAVVIFALSRGLPAPVSTASLGAWIGVAGLLVLIADRVRFERSHRWWISLAAPIFPWFLTMTISLVELRVRVALYGHGQTVTFGWMLLPCLAATWWLLVRRHEPHEPHERFAQRL